MESSSKDNPFAKSNRLQAKKQIEDCVIAIEIQSQFHLMIMMELKSKMSNDRVKELHRQLKESPNLKAANEHFDNAKQLGVSEERMNKLVREIDRVSEDRRQTLQRLKECMSMSARRSVRKVESISSASVHSSRAMQQPVTGSPSGLNRFASDESLSTSVSNSAKLRSSQMAIPAAYLTLSALPSQSNNSLSSRSYKSGSLRFPSIKSHSVRLV